MNVLKLKANPTAMYIVRSGNLNAADKIHGVYSDMGDAATELMAQGRGASILHENEEITYEELMLDK